MLFLFVTLLVVSAAVAYKIRKKALAEDQAPLAPEKIEVAPLEVESKKTVKQEVKKSTNKKPVAKQSTKKQK